MPPPLLVVVSGPAGSGTTSLAHALARAIPCPAICRDEIKEGLLARERIALRADETPARRIVHGDYSLLEPFDSFRTKFERLERIYSLSRAGERGARIGGRGAGVRSRLRAPSAGRGARSV